MRVADELATIGCSQQEALGEQRGRMYGAPFHIAVYVVFFSKIFNRFNNVQSVLQRLKNSALRT